MHHQQDVLIHHFIAQFITQSKPQNNILSEFEFITLMMKPNVLKLGHKCLYGVVGCRRPVAALITYSGRSIKTLLLPFKYLASCDWIVPYDELLAVALTEEHTHILAYILVKLISLYFIDIAKSLLIYVWHAQYICYVADWKRLPYLSAAGIKWKKYSGYELPGMAFPPQ